MNAHSGWLIGIVTLATIVTACGSHPTITPLPTPMPEQWPLPLYIENIKIEQSGNKFIVAFYMDGRGDTVGSGVVRFEVINELEEGIAGDCVQSTEDRFPSLVNCLLYRAEVSVSVDDFQPEQWDRADCAPDPFGVCLDEHLTYRFEPLDVHDAVQPLLEERVFVIITFEGSTLTGEPLKKSETFRLRNGQFKGGIIEPR